MKSKATKVTPKKHSKKKMRLAVPLAIASFVISFPFLCFSAYVGSESIRNNDYFINEAANTLRDLVGTEHVAWLESQWLTLQDQWNVWIHHNDQIEVNPEIESMLNHSFEGTDAPIDTPSPESWAESSNKPDTPPTQVHPPKDIVPLITKPILPEEGIWQPLYSTGSCLVYDPNTTDESKRDDSSPNSAPAYFYQTVIRPDQNRSWSKVGLVSVDLSRLELRFTFGHGYLDKENKNGTGGVPEEFRNRLIAAFNGGFLQVHDVGGMVIDGQERIPLLMGEATFLLYSNGEPEICEFSPEKSLEIFYSAKSIHLAFQNQPVIMTNGRMNEKVKTWGLVYLGIDGNGYDILSKTEIYGHRSALGVTEDHRLIYAIGDAVSTHTLGYALKMAGCTDAMHLDLNPTHICFAVFDHTAQNLIPKKVFERSSDLLASKYLEQNNRQGFFYLLEKPTKS